MLNSSAVFTCIKEVNFVELEPTFDGVDERIVNAIFNMTDKIAKEMSWNERFIVEFTGRFLENYWQ